MDNRLNPHAITFLTAAVIERRAFAFFSSSSSMRIQVKLVVRLRKVGDMAR
jgi:hypothetical protein